VKKSVVLGVLAGVIVLLIVSAWLVNARFSNLEAQIAELKSQNSELENQNSSLLNQTLQLKDRVKQVLEHRDEVYDSAVQITFFNWFGGFNPYVGLTLMYPVNVTIHNDGDVDARGLSLAV